jgi:hypothetical protein
MLQQVAIAMSIAVAATTLKLARSSHGALDPTQGDFQTAFVLQCLLALGGTLFCLRLAKNAGANVSGHNPGLHPV